MKLPNFFLFDSLSPLWELRGQKLNYYPITSFVLQFELFVLHKPQVNLGEHLRVREKDLCCPTKFFLQSGISGMKDEFVKF